MRFGMDRTKVKNPVPTKLLTHLMQNMLRDQYAEYDPDFTRFSQLEERKERSRQIPLDSIVGPDIHMYVATNDSVCPAAGARWTREQI